MRLQLCQHRRDGSIIVAFEMTTHQISCGLIRYSRDWCYRNTITIMHLLLYILSIWIVCVFGTTTTMIIIQLYIHDNRRRWWLFDRLSTISRITSVVAVLFNRFDEESCLLLFSFSSKWDNNDDTILQCLYDDKDFIVRESQYVRYEFDSSLSTTICFLYYRDQCYHQFHDYNIR